MKTLIPRLEDSQTYEFWISAEDHFGNESFTDMPSTEEFTFHRVIASDQLTTLFDLVEVSPASGTYQATMDGQLIFGSGGRIFLPNETTPAAFSDYQGTEILPRGIRVWESNSKYAMMEVDNGTATIEVVGGVITGGKIRTADESNTANQAIVMDGSDNTLKFYEAGRASASDTIIVIDDNIYSSTPGIGITDGIIYITDSSVSGVATMQGGYLSISAEDARLLYLHNTEIDNVDSDCAYFYSQDTSNYTYGINRIGAIGYSEISHADNTSDAIGLRGVAYNNGHGIAVGLNGVSDGIALRLANQTDEANDYANLSIDTSGYLEIEASGDRIELPSDHTIYIGTEYISATKISTWDSASATQLDDLDDVTITSVGDGEVLQFDSGSGDFINQTLAEAGIEPADSTILKEADVDDTPVNGVTTAPVSSNWAYDHINTVLPPPHDRIGDAYPNYMSTNVSGTDTLVEIANDVVVNHNMTITVDDGGDVVMACTGGTINFTSTDLQHGGNEVLDTSDVDDTPVDSATTAPISSNWAYDHVNTNHHDRILDDSCYLSVYETGGDPHAEFTFYNGQSGGDSLLLTVDDSGNVLLEPSGTEISVVGNIDASGSYQMDSSDIINVSGYQTGVLKTRQLLCFGYDTSIPIDDENVTLDMYTVDGSANGQGYRMIRAGTVTGVSIQCDVTDATSSGYLRAYVQLNGANQSMYASASISGTGDTGGSSTSNSFSFSVGDRINVEIDFDSVGETAAIENIAVLVEIAA